MTVSKSKGNTESLIWSDRGLIKWICNALLIEYYSAIKMILQRDNNKIFVIQQASQVKVAGV